MVLGKPWQPNTANNSPQLFNNAVRTQLFSTFVESRAALEQPSAAQETRETAQVLQPRKKRLLHSTA